MVKKNNDDNSNNNVYYIILSIIIVSLIILVLLTIFEDKLYEYELINKYKKNFIYDDLSLLSSVISSNNTDDEHIIFYEIILDKNNRFNDIKLEFVPLSDHIVLYISSKYGELFVNNYFFSKIIDGTESKPYIFKIKINKSENNTIVFRNYTSSSKIVVYSVDGFEKEE